MASLPKDFFLIPSFFRFLNWTFFFPLKNNSSGLSVAGCQGCKAFGLVLTLLIFSPGLSSAQTPEATPTAQSQEPDSSASSLKKMSLEQLMDLDVTSVSKQPEPYGEAPAAIDLITNDEIRRSGASNIPEALRLADSLDVAQKGSHAWAIERPGFQYGFRKQAPSPDGRPDPLHAALFRRFLGCAGLFDGGHRSNRGHQRSRGHPLGGRTR